MSIEEEICPHCGFLAEDHIENVRVSGVGWMKACPDWGELEYVD